MPLLYSILNDNRLNRKKLEIPDRIIFRSKVMMCDT